MPYLAMFSKRYAIFIREKCCSFAVTLKNWKLDWDHLKLYLSAPCSARKHWSFPFKDLVYYLSNGAEFNTQAFSHWGSFLAEVSTYIRKTWTVKELKCSKWHSSKKSWYVASRECHQYKIQQVLLFLETFCMAQRGGDCGGVRTPVKK